MVAGSGEADIGLDLRYISIHATATHNIYHGWFYFCHNQHYLKNKVCFHNRDSLPSNSKISCPILHGYRK